ncbi:hypothetical protein ACFLUO_08965 [Chloroflexota bacterium]
MVNEKGRKYTPPYVSYRTFQNFIDGLQLGIPAQIDRSYWGERFSGSNGTQLMTALRFLSLVDNSNKPLDQLRQLVSTSGSQREDTLKQILFSAYDFVADKSINPQVATYAQLEKAFHNAYNVTGDVARKCIKFFIGLERDAGIPLSPYMIKKHKTLQISSGKKKASIIENNRANRSILSSPMPSPLPTQNIWYEMILAKFPTFDPTWSDEIKLKWFEDFNSLLKIELVSDTDK